MCGVSVLFEQEKGKIEMRERGWVYRQERGGCRRGDVVGPCRAARCVGAVVLFACALLGVVGVPVASAVPVCPNEALRQESTLNPNTLLPVSMALPDCRAYELTDPSYKEGFPISGVFGISADGSRMIVGSFGSIAGTKADQFGQPNAAGVPYGLERSGSGWTTSPISPSPARFPQQEFVGMSGDLSRSVWTVREPSESIYARDLYMREPDGSFVKIGPMVPPSVTGPIAGYYPSPVLEELDVVGMSNDASHVLFTSSAPFARGADFLWPGDTTSATYSLYEYVGTGESRPSLVGVSDGTTAVDGVKLPAGALLGKCGTELGGASNIGDQYNAVSSDGERVFFTVLQKAGGCEGPVVNELYARIGGAETVHISEPTSAQCAQCLTGHTVPAVAEENAEFQGASEDGSKAFFLTEQELLGTKGMSLYEYDFNAPVGSKLTAISGGVVKPEVQGVVRVSEDGSHTYFVAKGALTTANAEGNAPTVGADNLYVFERDAAYPQGRIAFVATLAESDESDWERFSVIRTAQTTPDGRFLVFRSHADLTPDDTSGEIAPQIFEYDALRERLVRVSTGECPVAETVCGPGDEPGERASYDFHNDGNSNEEAGEARLPELAAVDLVHYRLGLAVSNDGSYVFFESGDGLTAGASDEVILNEVRAEPHYASNVYEYHSDVSSQDGSIADGNVRLISDGYDRSITKSIESGVKLYGTDASGGDVFFRTGDPLVGQDTNTQLDVYDARVDGGFPAPVSPVSCEEGAAAGGNACQGEPLTMLPFAAQPASTTTRGGENASPSLPTVPPSVSETKAKPKAKPLTRAQKLTSALRACKRESRRKRAVCRTRAEQRFGVTIKAKNGVVRRAGK